MARIAQHLLFLFLIILFFNSCGGIKKQDKETEEKVDWIYFQWAGDSIGQRYFDKAVMFVPFTLKGIPHKFKAQFDLGANASLIYGNSFSSYLSLYPEYGKKLDTVHTDLRINNQKQGELKDVELFLNDLKFTLKKLAYFKTYGEKIPPDSVNSSTARHIATLGADVLKNKLLIIDYPNTRLAILDSLPPGMKTKFDFVACNMSRGRFIIPLTINGKTQEYLFDTGASLFPIVTSEENWKSFCDVSFVDTLKVASWGNYYEVYGAKTNTGIYFNKIKLPPATAYMMPVKEILDMFKQEKISGITGNAYFLKSVIALDFKHTAFGVMRDTL